MSWISSLEDFNLYNLNKIHHHWAQFQNQDTTLTKSIRVVCKTQLTSNTNSVFSSPVLLDSVCYSSACSPPHATLACNGRSTTDDIGCRISGDAYEEEAPLALS